MAEAFVFFMMNERNRHLDDIAQIDVTVGEVCKQWGIGVPDLDPFVKIWTEVGEDSLLHKKLIKDNMHRRLQYLHNNSDANLGYVSRDIQLNEDMHVTIDMSDVKTVEEQREAEKKSKEAMARGLSDVIHIQEDDGYPD
jgi:hypothetical protein